MKRVVYIVPGTELGGTERSLLSTIEAAASAVQDYRPVLIVPGSGLLEKEARLRGVEVVRVEMPHRLASLGDSGAGSKTKFTWLGLRLLSAGPNLCHYLLLLRTALRAAQPDLIHAHGIKSHLPMAIFRPDKPVISHFHDFVSSRPLVRRLLPLMPPPSGCSVACSRAVADDVRACAPRLAPEVLYNAVNTQRFSPQEAPEFNIDECCGLNQPPAGTLRIGLPAAFARWKGQEVFLAAAARLLHLRPGALLRFYIIGGPIYRTLGSQYTIDELRAKAESLGLKEHVGFSGFREEMSPVYNTLDICVHCSTKPEPFGMVIIEAMSCGRCVIVARGSGPSEIVTEEQDALAVPSGDADALAHALARLVDDPALRSRLGCSGREKVQKSFSTAALAARLSEIYLREAKKGST